MNQLDVAVALGVGPPAVEHREEIGERVARGARQPITGDQGSRRLDQRRAVLARRRVEQLYTRGADATPGRVDDALEGKVVGRLVDEPQIGHRIPNFLALVEARAADHAIRQGERDKALLELAGLEAGAHQDRDAAQCVALAVQRLDLVTGPARLLLGVPEAAHGNLVALAGAGPQRLAEPAAIVIDDPGRGGKDLRRRTVILLQAHDQRAGEIALEFEDVLDLRAAPRVDRLVVVADAADVLVLLREQPQPQILRDVGVLVLVDQHIAEAVLICTKNVRVALEQR